MRARPRSRAYDAAGMEPPFPDEPFTWPMARALGIRRSDLDDAVLDGRVVTLLHGVHVRDDYVVTPLTRARAARLVISDHSVVRDRTAAWIWGVDCFGYSELDGTPALEYCVLRGHEPTDRDEVAGLTRDLVPDDWIEVDGLRVTTPLRTAMDLGCALPPHTALGAMDALMRAHGFTHHDVRLLLRRYRRRRGVVQLRRLVAALDPRAESQPESWIRWFIVAGGFHTPSSRSRSRSGCAVPARPGIPACAHRGRVRRRGSTRPWGTGRTTSSAARRYDAPVGSSSS